MIYTMLQACEITGMTYQGLKFYCNAGLVPNVKRDKNNRRIFDERDIAWIKSLLCLKDCGMSIKDMKKYLELCLEGPSSIPERKEILTAKRREIKQNIRELMNSMKFIDRKQKFYDEVIEGKRKYTSNLITCYYDDVKE